jgi:hypothetical protein
MWKCPRCGQENEAFYDACSLCGTFRDGSRPRARRVTDVSPERNSSDDARRGDFAVRRRRPWAYIPNEIPLKERFVNTFFSLGLITYGIIGLVIDDLYIPMRRRGGIHLHGGTAAVMFVAMALAACVLAATIVDHYDRRDNERHYKGFARVTGFVATVCCFVAVFWQMVRG